MHCKHFCVGCMLSHKTKNKEAQKYDESLSKTIHHVSRKVQDGTWNHFCLIFALFISLNRPNVKSLRDPATAFKLDTHSSFGWTSKMTVVCLDALVPE